MRPNLCCNSTSNLWFVNIISYQTTLPRINSNDRKSDENIKIDPIVIKSSEENKIVNIIFVRTIINVKYLFYPHHLWTYTKFFYTILCSVFTHRENKCYLKNLMSFSIFDLFYFKYLYDDRIHQNDNCCIVAVLCFITHFLIFMKHW